MSEYIKDKNTKNTEDNKIILKTVLIFGLSFLIPAVCGAICFAISGIYPGGEKTILATDLNQQIAEFLNWYHRFLNGCGSIMYSFEKGLGGNMFGLWAYYLSSPFALLMLFFEADKVHIAIWLMTVLKIGASGLTFAVFLRYMTKRLNISTIVFSAMYALMSYSITYHLIIMWLDGVIFLPLVIICAERILRYKKWKMFVLVYTLALITGYYTAYMITVFTVLWFVFRYFSVQNGLYFKRGAKDFISRTAVLAIAGITGALLGMCILLPTAMDIVSGKMSATLDNYVGFLTENIKSMPIKMFIGQYDSLKNLRGAKSGTPSTFISVFSMIMIFGFFADKKIELREKISALAVFAVFILSFLLTPLDKIWHMLLMPNWFPFRYVFCFSFFSIYIAYRAFVNIDGLNLAKRILSAAVPFALMLLTVIIIPGQITDTAMVIATFVVLTVYAAILFANYKFKSFNLNYTALIVMPILLFEMTANGAMLVKGIDKEFEYEAETVFEFGMNSAKTAVEQAEKSDNTFYRMETNTRRTINEPLGAGYRGASHFSSTFNNNYNLFHKRMGLIQESVNYSHNGATLVYDSIFGIKYIISDKEVNEQFNLIFESQNRKVYQNPYALPLGFMVENYCDAAVSDYSKNSYILNNNKFTDALFGKEFFSQSGKVTAYNEGKRIEIDTDGAVYMNLPKKYVLGSGINLVVNGEEVPYKYSKTEAKIIYLGEYKKGDVLEVYLKSENTLKNATFYTLDINALKSCVSRVKEESLNIGKFSDTYIEGTVNCKKDGYLFTTVLYEKNGWKAYVDGEEAEILKYNDLFNSIKLTEGTHTVVFKYRTPYLDLGIWISLITLTALICFIYFDHRRKNASAAAQFTIDNNK